MNINNQTEVGKWVQSLIDKNNLLGFYTSPQWRQLRKEVLRDYKKECQACKKKGFYAKASHVHHVQFVRRHPHLALSRTYIYQGEEYINLMPVCQKCHETVCHPERLGNAKKESTIPERWD